MWCDGQVGPRVAKDMLEKLTVHRSWCQGNAAVEAAELAQMLTSPQCNQPPESVSDAHEESVASDVAGSMPSDMDEVVVVAPIMVDSLDQAHGVQDAGVVMDDERSPAASSTAPFPQMGVPSAVVAHTPLQEEALAGRGEASPARTSSNSSPTSRSASSASDSSPSVEEVTLRLDLRTPEVGKQKLVEQESARTSATVQESARTFATVEPESARPGLETFHVQELRGDVEGSLSASSSEVGTSEASSDHTDRGEIRGTHAGRLTE